MNERSRQPHGRRAELLKTGVLTVDFSSRAETVRCLWTAVPATHVEMGEPAMPRRARKLASCEFPGALRWGWGLLLGPASKPPCAVDEGG